LFKWGRIKFVFYTIEQIEKTLNRIQKNHPEIEEIIVFYREIVKKQLKVKKNIQLPPIDLIEEKTREKFQKGVPLLELSLIPDSLEAYEPLAGDLVNLLKKRGPSVTAEMEKIRKDVMRDAHIFISLAQNYLLHNWEPIHALAQDHELDIGLLFFFIKSSVKPFVESLAEEITTKCNLPPWSEPSCPICGSLPSLAYLRPAKSEGRVKTPCPVMGIQKGTGKEGMSSLLKKGMASQISPFKSVPIPDSSNDDRDGDSRGKSPQRPLNRFLVCSLCNYYWLFPRLKCPFCQTERQDALHYFCINSDEKGIRVDVCNDCKGYIKTIGYEYEPLTEEVLFLEDLNTIHLDLMAENEGYCKKAKGIFSL
jgi:formate dehydrogenase maturation protein FdhE